MKTILKNVTVSLIFIQFATITLSYSQCAMCRATVESSSKSPKGKGKGLNNGILYLMSMPYILAAGIGYFWYRHSRKETAQKNRIDDLLKRKLN